MDKAPRFPIDPYKQRLYRAIAQIYQRYEDLGLEIAPGQYRLNQEKEAFCLLENKLVLFRIIDEPELLKELNPEALATAQQIAEGKFIIILQKIIFEMDSAILPIVLQRELDEIVIGLGGISLKDSSMRDQQEQVRKIIQTALERQLNLKLRKLENIPPKRVAVSTSAPGNNVYGRQLMPKGPPKRQRRGGRRKKYRASSNPGRDILEALIINYKGDLKQMARNRNIDTSVSTLSSWIKECGLQEFVEEQRKSREESDL